MVESKSDAPIVWYALDRPDVIFVGLTIAILVFARTGGMLGDPGLGWHLRYADQMLENRGFIYTEPFCFPTEGRPCVAQAWLGDILFRTAYGWGGLNAIAALTALTMAFVLRCLYTRMLGEGVPGLAAGIWIAWAALATAPSWVARPNIFSFVGLVLVAATCERFHTGTVSRAKTLWLVPVFLSWTNMHGGFFAGIIVLAVTWVVECLLSILTFKRESGRAARDRLLWLSFLSLPIFAATLVNPYGFGLHRWNFRLLTDPFIQTKSTAEWLPPDFAHGMVFTESLILAFPALAALSRKRISVLALALSVVWLHFALTTTRYSPMWVVVALPTLAALSCHVPWLKKMAIWATAWLRSETRESLLETPRKSPYFVSLVFAGVLLFGSRWMGDFATQQSLGLLPTAALDKFLTTYRGERVFHSGNWGGYLTWHGWNLTPRFKTWIDDRIDVHGREQTERYYAIMAARPDWEHMLEEDGVEMLCLPIDAQVTAYVERSANWEELFREGEVAAFRRSR